jgi:hypothetical protein
MKYDCTSKENPRNGERNLLCAQRFRSFHCVTTPAALLRTCNASFPGIRFDELAAETLMRPFPVIMFDIAFKALAQMPLAQRHDLGETLRACR